MGSLIKRFRWVMSVGLLGFLLSACGTSPTFLTPNSPVSTREANLYWLILWMAAGVFVLVEGLLIYNIIKYRRKGNDTAEPKQKYGNWRLEVIWTAIPIVLVLVLFIFTVTTIRAIAAPPAQTSDINVHVIGHQWWWEFDYPDLGIVTANELHIPQGATVQITLDSADVIHSFWVPQLSSKIDVIPGQTNHLWMKADQTGTFMGHCAEFCGLNHANMRIMVKVDSSTDFTAWVQNQQQPVAQATTPDQQAAFNLITKGICSNCHTLGDNQAKNPIAPNLTHLMSRSMFAGDTYPLTEENLRSWLTDNNAMKPGNDMSSIKLQPDQINQLISYLLTLK